MINTETSNIDIHELEKILIGSSISGSALDAKYNVRFTDAAKQTLEIRMDAYIWGEKTEKKYIRYPRSCWEWFKLDYFPNLLFKKFPVKYNVIDISFEVTYPNFKYFSKDNRVTQIISTDPFSMEFK